MTPIHKILVGTDFSETSDLALDFARRIAKPAGATIVLVHAYALPHPVTAPEAATTALDIEQLVVRAATSTLERLAMNHSDAGVPVEPLLRRGDPAQAIVDAARQTHSDLVIVGTHGRRGVGHAILGSVAEEVLRSAPCPVLTVRLPPS